MKQVPISILIQRFFSHKDVQNVIKARGCATTKLTLIFGSFILKSNTSINFHSLSSRYSLKKRNNGKEERANKHKQLLGFFLANNNPIFLSKTICLPKGIFYDNFSSIGSAVFEELGMGTNKKTNRERQTFY